MLLPLGMLCKLRIRKSQKIGLVLGFSVCLLTIGLELFRFVRNMNGDTTANNVLYAVINANLTIMISCSPTYRSLWSLWQKSRAGTSSNESLTEAHAYPRHIVQKPAIDETDISCSESTYNEELSFPLQKIDHSSSCSS